MLSRGWRVTAAAGGRDEQVTAGLREMGVTYIPLDFNRSAIDAVSDARVVRKLAALLRAEAPDVFLGYTLKPALYGTLAARIAGVPRRIAMLEGLGYAFTPGRELRRLVSRAVLISLFSAILPLATVIVALNPDDAAFVKRLGWLIRKERICVVPGIGVDLAHHAPAAMPPPPVKFVMIARLLRDKGIYEYVEAARQLKRDFPDVEFYLIGARDSNPSSVTEPELESWISAGTVRYFGEREDIRPFLRSSHVLVLPSYREGFPVTPMEAFATGRPVIVTDVPGCREVVSHGKTGWLVEPQDVPSLEAAMREAIATPLAPLGAAAAVQARLRFAAPQLARALADRVTDAVS
jgi:glycosyltransferase involved in cell wall biosynthesis